MFDSKTDFQRRYRFRDVVTSGGAASREVTTISAPDLSGRALALVLVASFMVVLDFSIVNVALPSIRHALSFGGDSVEWVVTAYAITFSGLLILGGRIADLFGRRRTFVVGLLVFAGASLVAGWSVDAAQLIVARGVQGVGAALVAPASLSLITARLAEGPRRTRALALYGATASIGFVAGQVVGGIFVQYLGWAWIFLINVPVGVAAAIFASRVISSDRQRSAIAHLDIGGGVLTTLSVAAAVFAISEGPSLGWDRPLIVGALVTALVGLAALIVVERLHSHPLIDLGVIVRRNLVTSGTVNFLMGAWNAGEMVVLSVYLQQTLHDSPLLTGLVIAPQGIMGFFTGMFGTRLVRRLGLRRLLIVSTLAAGIGFLALIDLPSSGHVSSVFGAVILVGFGTVGTVMAATIMATQGMAESDQGLVGGVINTCRQIGAALGVAVLFAIAEGSHATLGASTIGGDRMAMFAAALIALSGTLVALFSDRPTTARTRRAIPVTPSALQVNAQVGAIVPLVRIDSQQCSSGKRSNI
jgi:EmrB/QacA subfamily drug resistance transporter